MNDAQLWALLVGTGAPPFIAIIQQPTWPKPVRASITILVCLILGVMTSYVNGELAGRSVVTAILLCLVAAWSSYGRFWKPIGAAGAIEMLTSHDPADDLDPLAQGYLGRPDGLPEPLLPGPASVAWPPPGPALQDGPEAPPEGSVQADGPSSRDQ